MPFICFGNSELVQILKCEQRAHEKTQRQLNETEAYLGHSLDQAKAEIGSLTWKLSEASLASDLDLSDLKGLADEALEKAYKTIEGLKAEVQSLGQAKQGLTWKLSETSLASELDLVDLKGLADGALDRAYKTIEGLKDEIKSLKEARKPKPLPQDFKVVRQAFKACQALQAYQDQKVREAYEAGQGHLVDEAFQSRTPTPNTTWTPHTPDFYSKDMIRGKYRSPF